MNGHPMILYESEGVPPLPSELDDEWLDHAKPSFIQHDAGRRQDRMSVMVGFRAVTEIFIMISQCLNRHRVLLNSAGSSEGSRESVNEWIVETKHHLQQLLVQLPFQLRPEYQPDTSADLAFGIQAANICVTALCLELALVSEMACHAPSPELRLKAGSASQPASRSRHLRRATQSRRSSSLESLEVSHTTVISLKAD